MTVLANNPVLLLAVILGIGYAVGSVRVGGVSLGVTAVFFAGLAASAIDARLRLPDFVDQFGLVLFVYAVGLGGGPAFFRTLKKRGLRDNAFTVAVLAAGALVVAGAAALWHLRPATAAGVFAGGSVNVPALAGALDTLKSTDPTHAAARGADAVIGMSLTYPVGVIAMILAIIVFLRFVKPDFAAEARANTALSPAPEEIVEQSVRVTVGAGADLLALTDRIDGEVILCRLVRDGRTRIAGTVDHLERDDVVNMIGTHDAVDEVVHQLGEPTTHRLSLDRKDIDFRRMSVSNPQLAGATIASLDLINRYGALVTRVRRGDADLLATGKMQLWLGDRIRIVAPRKALAEVAELLGDSETALGQVDLKSLTLGIAGGLLLGLVPVPLPGGTTVKLGIAGGPILAGLVLGYLGKTGPFTWQLPRNVNTVLRQLGVVLFFAGVGTKSGHAFVAQLEAGHAVPIILAGALLSFATAIGALLVGYYLLRVPMSLLMGLMAGLGTNPAVLSLAEERAGNDLPAVGYATVFPVAMVVKIVIGELLIQLLH